VTEVPREVKAAVSARDLLSRPDAQFVACAYITLLGRPADPEGFWNYWLRLRCDGDKLAIIHALCSSDEGRIKQPCLPGLRSALVRHHITHWLRLRRLVAWHCSVPWPAPAPNALLDKPTQTGDAASDDQLDPAWYVNAYPSVALAGLDPHEHYRSIGMDQGLLPNAARVRRLLIDDQAYFAAYPDAAQSGMSAWDHYVIVGRGEGRTEGVSLDVLQFDRDWYMKSNPDVAQLGLDALQHFATSGILHGRDSSSFKGLRCIVPESRTYTDPLPPLPVKVIAFWGPGFPDWTFLDEATPCYAEHDQPRLVGDLGRYGRHSPDLMKRQAELASGHGVTGFCFHANGRRSSLELTQALDLMLSDRSIDIGFCLRFEADSPPIERFAQCLSDPRYIRVEGKPLLIIDWPEHLSDPFAAVARWRARYRELGIDEIHLCSIRTTSSPSPALTGVDATIEFPPATSHTQPIASAVPGRNAAFTGQIYSYLAAAKAACAHTRTVGLEYRGVMPGWDDTPELADRGSSFYGATPELYAEWLGHALDETICALPPAHRLVFINAWNAWGKSAYLEPDGRHGYAYLNRTREALAAIAPAVVNDADLRARTCRSGRVAVVVHLHYDDLLEAMAGYVENVPEACDLYVSVRDGSFKRVRQLVRARWPEATVVSYPNRGRDVLPFLQIVSWVRGFGYDAICKVHSKKSRQRDDGDRWRSDVLAKLLGSRERVAETLDKLRGGAGLVAPGGHWLSGVTHCGSNRRRVAQLAEKMGCPAAWMNDFSFPAGTMFWCRPEALAPLLDLGLGHDDFEPENGQADGTTAHAWERLVGLSTRKSGWPIITTGDEPGELAAPYPFAKPTAGNAPHRPRPI
jgi:lipopolysaccharide biosynthesis protein